MADKQLPAKEQLEILMRGTRFADETDEWGADLSESSGLHTE